MKYRVITASCGKKGLELAQKHVPDLVISDVMMPGMNGIELCNALKEDQYTSHVPIILLTAKTATEDELEGLAAGADDYVAKPFQARVLMSRAANLIESRRRLSEYYGKYITPKASEVEASSMDEKFVADVVSLIEKHLGDPAFGVYELSDEMGFSRRQLHRKLSALTGISPLALIRKIRMERAAQLLQQQAATVAEVAYAVGYNQPKHFSKLFHEAYGVNPSEYAASLASSMTE